MKKSIFLLVLIAGSLLVPIGLFAEGHGADEPHFTVSAPQGEQSIGGKSGHSSHEGLHKAEEKSPVIEHEHEHEE